MEDQASASPNHLDEAGYDALLRRVSARFVLNVDGGNSPLFTTDASGLWEAYLNGFPTALRQYHHCSECERFIRRFGGLITIVSKSGPVGAKLKVKDKQGTMFEYLIDRWD